MLTAYCDASGTHAGSQVLTVSGLLSTPAQWELLAKEWRQVLGAYGLPDFHASDCASGGGVFKDRSAWPHELRLSLHRRLGEIVAKRALSRLWAVVVIEDYVSMFGDVDREKKWAFGICAGCCAGQAAFHAFGTGSAIPFVFDRGDRHGQLAFDAFRQMDQFGMGSLEQGNRREILPLQAADLHAYEVYRYFSDQVLSSKDGTSRTTREVMRPLLSIPEAFPGGGGHVLVGESLFEMRKYLQQTGSEDMAMLPLYRLDAENQPRLSFQPLSVEAGG